MKAGVTAEAVARPAPSISQEPVRESHDRLRKRKTAMAIVCPIVLSLVRGGEANGREFVGIHGEHLRFLSRGDDSAAELRMFTIRLNNNYRTDLSRPVRG